MFSPPPLISAVPDLGSLYLVLFLAFGVAMIIWIILRTLATKSELVGGDDLAEPEPEPEPEPDLDFSAATEEEAANLFSEELSSGIVKQDPTYGIVYTKAPDEVDDLKRIKGVAKVLEGKLHGIGVYRFKQIAVWTDAACAEFSKLLTFKNRIYQDNWIAQAKEFHKDKYGDDL